MEAGDWVDKKCIYCIIIGYSLVQLHNLAGSYGSIGGFLNKLMVVAVVALICCLIVLSGCESKQSEAERQRVARMNEQISRAYNSDILEMRDGSFALVTGQNDFGLVIRYAIGASGRQSYETLSERVIAVYTKDHPDRCQILEKFIASF